MNDISTPTPIRSESGAAAPKEFRALDLPSPAELPEAEVLIFDGDCRFCLATIGQLRWFDGKDRLSFLSLHDPVVRERYPDLDHERLMSEMVLVDREEGRHGGAAALKYLSRRLPKLWLLAPFMHIPGTMPFWRWAYGFVARRRYQIAGRMSNAACDESSCRVHFGE